jgi:hypothetical protein
MGCSHCEEMALLAERRACVGYLCYKDTTPKGVGRVAMHDIRTMPIGVGRVAMHDIRTMPIGAERVAMHGIRTMPIGAERVAMHGIQTTVGVERAVPTPMMFCPVGAVSL